MLSQSFGDAVASNDVDIINAIEFDLAGSYFATGDRGGRIVVFRSSGERRSTVSQMSQFSDPSQPAQYTKTWSPFFQFQSHDPEFDYLKSVEIEEKINQIKFGPSIGDNLFILSTNDKTVKLWKVSQAHEYVCQAAESYHQKRPLTLPSRTMGAPVSYSTLKRIYQNAHAYNVNSISLNSDMESFVSCDDLRINMWRFDSPDTCFTLVDLKPARMEELAEVITAGRCHPQHCHSLAFSTSRGTVKLVDSRSSALCDTAVACMSDPDNSTLMAATNFADMVTSITDINYDNSGMYIASRDYLMARVWDTRMTNQPVTRIPVQDNLTPYLADLMDAECIFDKFEIHFSPNASKIVTGSYSNQFYVHDALTGARDASLGLPGVAAGTRRSLGYDPDSKQREIRIPRAKIKGVPEIRADQKILHCAWHPHDPMLAIGGQAGLYIYQL